MKALTVQQPWAWAIFHGKDVENRTQAFKYRGPVAIHAGLQDSPGGWSSDLIDDAIRVQRDEVDTGIHRGAIIGVVDLVDAHRNNHGHRSIDGCCASRWAEQHAKVHLVLANPRLLDRPIPCKGALGLWTPPADIVELLQAVTHA